jgi:lysophospholipase L1-like esterase
MMARERSRKTLSTGTTTQSICLAWLLAWAPGFTFLNVAQAQRTYTMVSVGDSVASGEGNPDVPQTVVPNPDFNPLRFTPNPNYNPVPQGPNPDYNPVERLINPEYNPVQRIINPDYQPYPIPQVLVPLLPNFPPYDPDLTIPNPDYDPNLTRPNPDYDPAPLVTNPTYDTNLFTEVPNPDFNETPYIVTAPAQWAKEADHRSNLGGPALAAAVLRTNHPNLHIDFLHRAKSGAKTTNVAGQIDKALVEAGGRIDILTISVGGNDVGGEGFGHLIMSCVESLKSGERCSENDELNARIDRSFAEMPALFAQLATHIRQCEVGAVFITEYFDLTRGSDGAFCGTFPGPVPGASAAEMEWAYEKIVVPLNAAVQAAAAAHGWHYVGGIAESFANHGYCADRNIDPRPVLPNPDYDPRTNVFNFNYDPVPNLPNLGYNPVQNIPNLDYDPVRNKPNTHYDPRRNIANPNYQPFPLLPKYDPRVTISNPTYDPRLTVTNPDYDPRLTVPNPDHDPDLTVPNPNYDPNLTKPNPNFDPNLTQPNPDFTLVPVDGDNWVVRLEESLVVQGDQDGTAHPNAKGHAVYRDRLVEVINRVGFDSLLRCPRILNIERLDSTIRLRIASDYPSDHIEIQRATNLNQTAWDTAPATWMVLQDQTLEAEVAKPNLGATFFRVWVR